MTPSTVEVANAATFIDSEGSTIVIETSWPLLTFEDVVLLAVDIEKTIELDQKPDDRT